MSRRTKRLFCAALVALAVPLAACDVAFQGMNASATDEWKRTYTLASGGRFELSNLNGVIDIAPSADATTVEVVAVRRARASSEQAARDLLKSMEITENASPSAIAIEVARTSQGMHFGGNSREVNFKVKVPKDAFVKLNTLNGPVHVSGLLGGMKIDTTNGEITGENLSGTIQAGTTNGGITMHVMKISTDGIRLDTTNGEIELRVPADTKADILAKWTHGSFEATGLKPEGESDRRRYEGKLNGGGPRIELSTTNGAIKISS